jgi:hypothetical protein
MTVTIKGGSQKTVMLFGEHARELISPEAGLRFMKLLCGKAGGLQARMRAKRALQKYTFLIFPNVNPDGRRIVEDGRYCHRTNGNHVDLNRNWNIGWHLVKRAEVASGPSAFSEKETKLVRDVVTAYAPHVFMSIHSGALGMYTPYAYTKANTVRMPDQRVSQYLLAGRRTMIDILRDLNRDFCRCGVGAAAQELNYLCPGNCLDYAFENLRVPYSFAFEIWDGQNYANQRSASLIEADAEEGTAEELDVSEFFEHEAEHSHSHEHGHSHGHDEDADADTDADAEEEAEEEAEANSAASFVQLASDIAPTPRRGHSCLSNPGTFAPTEELEGLVALELDATVSRAPAAGGPRTANGFVLPFGPNAHATCFQQFNPSGKQQYEETVNHWAHAFAAILDRLPHVQSL